MALEGGYNVDTLAEAGTACAQALLGQLDTMKSVRESHEAAVKSEAEETVMNVIRTQKLFWKCLKGYE